MPGEQFRVPARDRRRKSTDRATHAQQIDVATNHEIGHCGHIGILAPRSRAVKSAREIPHRDRNVAPLGVVASGVSLPGAPGVGRLVIGGVGVVAEQSADDRGWRSARPHAVALYPQG